jgi:hypothetical protein
MRKHTAIAGLTLLLMVPSARSAAAEAATVPTEREAWYDLLNPCRIAGSCPAEPPATRPYPADTLHVGVTAGLEDSRTYLTLDLAALPTGARVLSGTLTLPVAGSDAGTQNATAAKLTACLVTGRINNAQGSTAAPPATDCGTRSDASLVSGSAGPAFTIDLTRFGTRLQQGLAVMASEESMTAGTSWHVAFNGKSRAGGNTQPITARLAYEAPAVSEGAGPVGAPASRAFASFSAPGTLERPSEPTITPNDDGQRQRSLSAAPVAQPAPSTSTPGGFAYPAIFWLPLVVLAVAGYLAYGLTRRVPIRRT